MPDIFVSKKLALGRQAELCIVCEGYVCFRIVVNEMQCQFMTATASEDNGIHRVFTNQDALIREAKNVFFDMGIDTYIKKDHVGRSYVEVLLGNNKEHIKHISTSILERLNMTSDTAVLAVRELKDIHADLSVDGIEDAYLCDGMYVTRHGVLYEE